MKISKELFGRLEDFADEMCYMINNNERLTHDVLEYYIGMIEKIKEGR